MLFAPLSGLQLQPCGIPGVKPGELRHLRSDADCVLLQGDIRGDYLLHHFELFRPVVYLLKVWFVLFLLVPWASTIEWQHC